MVDPSHIRHAYTQGDKADDERRNQWFVYVVVRPLSFRLAPRLLAAGLSPNQVTLAGLLLSLLLPALACLPAGAAPLVAVAALLFLLLDCLDGDMARGSGTTSPAGHYLDMVVDVIHRMLLYLAVGILAARNGGLDTGPLLGLAAAWVALAARWCRNGLAEDVYDRTTTKAPTVSDYVFWFFAGLDQLLPLAIVAAWATDTLPGLTLAVLGYSGLDFVTTQSLAWRRLRR